MNQAASARDPRRRRERRWPAFLQRGKKPEPLPIVLDRKRIFILPTGFGIGFALVLLVMLLGALNYANNAAVLLTSLLGAVAAGSMLTTFRGMDGLRLDGVHAGSAFAGETIRVSLDLAVSARARHALHLDLARQTIAFDMPEGRGRTLEAYLPTRSRGWLDLPRLRVHTTWPFGMFRAWSLLSPQRRVLVYPRPESSGPPAPGLASRTHADQTRAGGDDLASLRAYRSGDPVKLVAWKASARHEDLLVREFEQPASRQPWHLAWSDTEGLAYEARIARLARWVRQARDANAHWSLALPERSLGPASDREHYHQCMRALALLP